MSTYKPKNCLICGDRLSADTIHSDNFLFYNDEDIVEQGDNYKKIRVPCTVMYSMDNKAVFDTVSRGGYYYVEDVQHDFNSEPPKTILTIRR